MRPLSLLKGFGVGLGSVTAFAGFLVLHTGTPPGRRLAVGVTNQALAESFKGRIVVERIDKLFVPAGRIAFAGRVIDPHDAEVVRVNAARLRFDVKALVRSLASSGPLAINIEQVDIDGGRVLLLRSRAPNGGGITLGETFEPRAPSAPSTEPSKGVVVRIVPIHLSNVRVEGDFILNLAMDVKDLRGDFHMGNDDIVINLAGLEGNAWVLGAGPIAVNARGSGALPFAEGAMPRVAVDATLTTKSSAAAVTAKVDAERNSRTASMHVRARGRMAPELARELGLPLEPTAPLEFDAQAIGPLADVAVEANVKAGGGSAKVVGRADVERYRAKAHLDFNDIDAHVVHATAPVSRVSGFADVQADGKTGKVTGHLHLDRGEIAGQVTPVLDADMTLDRARATLEARATEPGTTANVNASLELVGAQILTVDAEVASTDLARLREVAPQASGSAGVKTHAIVNLTSGTVAGNVSGHAERFAWADLARVRSATFTAKLGGTIKTPSADVRVYGKDVKVASIVGDRVDAGALLTYGSIHLQRAFVELQRGDTVIRADAAHVRVANGVTVNGARVTGLGGPITADFKSTPGQLAIKAHGEQIELEPLARIGALPENIRGGGDLDVDVTLDASGVHGHANVALRGVEQGRETLRGSIALQGRGRTMDIESHVVVDPIGRVDIARSEIRIDGDPRKPATWKRAAGAVTAEADVGVAELVARFVDPEDVKLEGRAHTKVRLDRATPGGPVAITFDVETKGLVAEVSGMSMRGAEVRVHGLMTEDDLRAEIEAFDAHGAVLTARGAVKLRDRKRSLAIGKMPLHATLIVPARSLDPFDFGRDIAGKKARAAAVVETDGTLDRPRFSGWARANLEGLGSLRIDELSAEWDRAREPMPHGSVVARARLDLESLAKRLREQVESMPQLSGLLDVDVSARRDVGDGLPSGRVAIRSYGLRAANETTALVGTDIRATAEIHTPTGEVSASATTWDKRGPLAILDAKALLPESITASSMGRIAAGWSHIPLSVRVTMPPRKLVSLPLLLEDATLKSDKGSSMFAGVRNVDGGVAFEAALEGTVEKPEVIARAYGLALRNLEPPRRNRARKPAVAIDASLFALYDGKRADVGFTVVEKGRPALQGALTALVSAADIVRTGEATVRASADIQARKFDVGSLPVIGTTFKGKFDGNVMLRDYGEDARVEASLKGTDVSYGNVKFTTAEARLYAHGDKLAGAVGLEQAGGGWAGAHLTSGMRWGSATAPALDQNSALRLDYKVDHFRLSGLRPLVRDIAPELDGEIEGTGQISRSNEANTAHGTLSLRKGSAYLTSLGQTIEDAQLDLRLTPEGTFTVENASAKIDRGELKFAASGRLKGLVPSAVKVDIRLSDKRELPIYLEGVRYGNVSGRVALDLKITEREIRLDVDVPKLRFELADLDPRSVQKLDAAQNVAIGVRDRDGKLELVRLQTLQKGADKRAVVDAGPVRPFVVHTHLGNDVVVSQGQMIYAPLSGDLQAIMAEELRLKGRIELRPGGIINVKGRKFSVRNGTITWTEDDPPANPVVIASAEWEAPDKTMVVASFTGPAATGKLDLRSEPAHTNGEILTLLLFGTLDGQSGTGSGGGGGVAGTAASVGGGVATGGLSQAMSKLTDIEIEAKIENPDANTTRPEVAVRVSPSVTLELGYNIAPPAVQRDKVMLTIDWRFAQRWSLEATEGDRGTSIFDLLWQYRY